MLQEVLSIIAATGLKGGELILFGIVAASVIIIWRVAVPNAIAKKTKKHVVSESKVEIDRLLKEKAIFIDENNALIKLMCNRLEKIENALTSTKNDWKFFENTSIERLTMITNRIDKLYEIVSDHEEFAASISQGTLENMVFNESMPAFRRLKAFRRLLAMGKNGRVKSKGKGIISQNKETWIDVLDMDMDIKMGDQKYYDNAIADIEKMLTGGEHGNT
ncbi:MAG: hypothetical protein FWF38_03760 [Spirochaetaceae bacterium]|nr:hypothetical protein [Spirochaetaceae bacterium]